VECLDCYATLRRHRRSAEEARKSDGEVARRVHVGRHYACGRRKVNQAFLRLNSLDALYAIDLAVERCHPIHIRHFRQRR
jgi:hypothetical protein